MQCESPWGSFTDHTSGETFFRKSKGGHTAQPRDMGQRPWSTRGAGTAHPAKAGTPSPVRPPVPTAHRRFRRAHPALNHTNSDGPSSGVPLLAAEADQCINHMVRAG